MTRDVTLIAEPRAGADRQIIIPCDCVGVCECLFVAGWDDGEGYENWQSFQFFSSYRVDHWRSRLKSAWLALRGKQPFYHDIVASPEQGRKLGEWLTATTAHRKGVHYFPVSDETAAEMGDWSEPVEVKIEGDLLLFRAVRP